MMRVTVQPRGHKPQHLLHAFKEGFVYAFGFAPMRAILLLVAVTSLMIMPLSTLMPIFADKVLRGGLLAKEQVFGLLLGASGVGAFAGTMYLASRRSVLRSG